MANFSQRYAANMAGLQTGAGTMNPDVNDQLPMPARMAFAALNEAPSYMGHGLVHGLIFAGYDHMRIANTQAMGGWAGPEKLSGGKTIGRKTFNFASNLTKRLSPRSLTRYSYSDRVIEESAAQKYGPASGGEYALAKITNYGLMGKQTGKLKFGSPLTKQMKKWFPQLDVPSYGPGASAGETNTALSGGWGGLNLNARRAGRGSLGSEKLGTLYDTMLKNNPQFGEQGAFGISKEVFAGATGEDQAAMIRATGGRGAVGQWLGGFVSQSRAAKYGDPLTVTRGALDKAGADWSQAVEGKEIRPAGQMGMDLAEKWLARGAGAEGERLGLRAGMGVAYRTAAKDVATEGGEAVAGWAAKKAAMTGGVRAAEYGAANLAGDVLGDFIPGLNVIMAAKTVFDIGKLTGKLVNNFIIKPAAQFAKDAYKSYEGGINKAPGTGWRGMGFRDTEASATSRQRGVAAIQNSRLNARSVLGSEAAMLYTHFG